MMSNLFEPLEFAFMRDALLVGSVVAAMCAVLSCFLILRGWSLMGDAISHAVLPGIVIAYIIGWPLAVGAFIAGLFCAVSTGFIQQNSRLKEDTVMGVVFTGLFAFGLVLFSRTPSDMHLDHILVGNILGISKSQFAQTLWMGAAVLAVTLVLRRDLLLICFDPGQARVMALPARVLNYLLLGLLSLAIVVSLQTVGIILVIAMLVTPREHRPSLDRPLRPDDRDRRGGGGDFDAGGDFCELSHRWIARRMHRAGPGLGVSGIAAVCTEAWDFQTIFRRG
jgi:manganese/iron transport system permease protein